MDKKGEDIEDYKFKYLILFMILWLGFNMDFMKSIIKILILNIEKNFDEYKLFMYVLFFVIYMLC